MKKNRGLIAGAYVASISLRRWDVADETVFFKELKARPDITGLEHAFYGKLHRYDDNWFLEHIDPAWDFVWTCLPGTTETLKTEPAVGLASNDKVSQKKALEFISAARTSVQKLNHFLKRKSVIAVQIHSAPAQNSSKEAFAAALKTICAWDWEGAQILVEHCDAFRPDGAHAKGFLPLEDEIWVVKKVLSEKPTTPLAMTLNWGRSTVEGRSPATVLEQIERLKKENLLKGFIFSGTTKEFADKHTPPPTPVGDKICFADSLMTAEEIKKTIAILPDDLNYLGFKIMPTPLPDDCRENLVYIDQMIRLMQ